MRATNENLRVRVGGGGQDGIVARFRESIRPGTEFSKLLPKLVGNVWVFAENFLWASRNTLVNLPKVFRNDGSCIGVSHANYLENHLEVFPIARFIVFFARSMIPLILPGVVPRVSAVSEMLFDSR